MSLPKVPSWAWLAWVGAFFALEGLAVANGWNNGDTLSENIINLVPGWCIYGLIGWGAWHFRKAR